MTEEVIPKTYLKAYNRGAVGELTKLCTGGHYSASNLIKSRRDRVISELSTLSPTCNIPLFNLPANCTPDAKSIRLRPLLILGIMA